MNPIVDVALGAWIPFVLLLFATMPARRAALIAFIGGWLFLPVAGWNVTGFKTKDLVVSVGLLAGSLVFSWKEWRRLRPRWLDLPMAIWCLWPAVTAIANDLGAYEAGSAVFSEFLSFGVPYLLGRLYFGTPTGVRDLSVALFVGGLAYAPLCLYEIRMSPQLHRMVYGFGQSVFDQTLRGGGYRPMVFMHHGLMVGFWMAAASLMGISLWRSGALRSLFGIPIQWLVLPLVATTILCKSTGATILLALGTIVMLVGRRRATALFIAALALLPPAYVVARVSGAWAGTELIHSIQSWISAERAESMQFRINNENLLVAKATEKRLTGWGRFGRFMVHDEDGRDLSTPDGLWVIALGQYGLVGLAALGAALLLPALRISHELRWSRWPDVAVTPAVALAVLLTLFAIDSLFNAMVSPLYMLAAGALTGLRPLRGPLRLSSPSRDRGRMNSRSRQGMRSPAPGTITLDSRRPPFPRGVP